MMASPSVALVLQQWVRSGYLRLADETQTGVFRDANDYGWYWSTGSIEKSTSTSTYNLGFDADDVSPASGPVYRRNGDPLRCLSTTAVGMRSGFVLPDQDKSAKVNQAGYYRSSYAINDSVEYASALQIHPEKIFASTGADIRSMAMPLRCLSTTAVGKVRMG